MQDPRLAENGDHIGVGLDECLQVRVVGGRVGGVSGRAERADGRAGPLDVARLLEEGLVLGVGAGPSALDHVDPKRVQAAGNAYLVAGRERDVLALGAVAEGGVE